VQTLAEAVSSQLYGTIREAVESWGSHEVREDGQLSHATSSDTKLTQDNEGGLNDNPNIPPGSTQRWRSAVVLFIVQCSVRMNRDAPDHDREGKKCGLMRRAS